MTIVNKRIAWYKSDNVFVLSPYSQSQTGANEFDQMLWKFI